MTSNHQEDSSANTTHHKKLASIYKKGCLGQLSIRSFFLNSIWFPATTVDSVPLTQKRVSTPQAHAF